MLSSVIDTWLSDDDKASIKQSTTISNVNIFKNLKVLTLGLFFDNFTISLACLSNTTKEIIAKIPNINISIFDFDITNPITSIKSDVINNIILVKSFFFIIFPSLYFLNISKKLPRTSWITEVLIE